MFEDPLLHSKENLPRNQHLFLRKAYTSLDCNIYTRLPDTGSIVQILFFFHIENKFSNFISVVQ